MELEQLVYSLPSTRAFLDGAIEDGLRSDATIILIPDHLSREMVGRLIRNRMRMLNLSIGEVFDPGDSSPVIATAEAMRVTWLSGSTRRNIGNLLRSEGLPDILYVQRLATGDSTYRQQWTEFIIDWVRESRALRSSGRPVTTSLCIIAKLRDFQFTVPLAEPGLNVRWWWGFPSALEVRLACRMANQRTGDGLETAGRWREHVLPGLVASDVQLGEYMWDQITELADGVVEELVNYWTSLEQTDNYGSIDDVVDLVKADNGVYAIGQELPPNLRRLWASGTLVYTPEYGLEVHPALLAYKARYSDVRHMLWRGQSELLLPMLNEMRLRICESMTDTYGDDWPTKWWKPSTEYELKEVEQTPLGTEFGHIDYLLRHVGSRSSRHPLYEKSHLARLVLRAKNIRNQIAHYSPVSFQEFANVCDERASVGI